MNTLYTDLLSFIPISGFYMYGNCTLHTFELTKNEILFEFYSIYGKLRSYIVSLAKNDSKFKKLLKSFPYDFSAIYEFNKKTASTHYKKGSKRFRSKENIRRIYFPAVPVTYGIKLKLCIIKDMGIIKAIIDPAIVHASHINSFDPMTYDYMTLAQRNDEFWKNVIHHVFDFFASWKIHGNLMDPYTRWRLTRTDLTCNIIVDRNYSIKTLLYYYRRTLKRCGYSVQSFSHPGQDAQTAECWNKSQRFVAYNKSYEQQSKYGRSYPYNIMRFEVRILPRKMFYIKKLIRKVFGIRQYPLLNNLLFSLVKLSPFIIYKEINNIFDDGDFYTEKTVKKKLKKLNCREETKNDIMQISIELSSYSSYSAIQKQLSLYKDVYGENIINYRLSLIRNMKISPILLEDRHSYRYKKLPSIKTVFLSSILNSSLNGLSDEFKYIQSFNDMNL